MIEAVLFDIDGTLLDHDRASVASLRGALERELGELSDDRHAAGVVEWQRLEELHYAEYLSGEIAVEEQRRRRAAGILRWLGAEQRGPAELEAWFEGFLDGYREHWRLFEDVEATLTALERRGLSLGVITNAVAALQQRKLDALGIGARLPHFISSSEVGVAKPGAEIFHAGCRSLGLAAEAVAYVGDRLETDARGARDAGLLGVWLNRDPARAAVEDVPTVRGLDELPRLLSSAGRER